MRGATLSVETKMVVEECYACHVPFAMTQEMKDALFKSKENFYCPAGHPQCYVGESDKDRIRRLEREKQELEERRVRDVQLRDGWLANETERHKKTKQELTTTKGQLTKTKKRVANGVCPCCGRTFVSLGRHMKTKHPDYEGEPRTDVTPDALADKAVAS